MLLAVATFESRKTASSLARMSVVMRSPCPSPPDTTSIGRPSIVDGVV